MRSGVFSVFCDESGFTGADLLNPAQPYFAYAAVQIAEHEATQLIDDARRKHGITGEFKASGLVRFNRGRKAIDDIVTSAAPRTRAVFYEKSYAMAGKFYEYVFEPSLPNTFFYDIGFNKFIANLIYLEVLAAPSVASPWLRSFQQYVWSGEPKHLDLVALRPGSTEVESILGDIVAFARLNRTVVTEEIEGLRRESGRMNPWVLDVTNSALYEVLRAHGEDLEVLDVTFDESQVVAAHREFFDVMVGRTDRPTIRIGRIERVITFNLRRPIQLASSHRSSGIQVADVVAGALEFALTNRREDCSRRWLSSLIPRALQGTVAAELERVRLDEPRVRFHALLLRELVVRSERGVPLMENFEPFLEALASAGELPDYDAILER